MRSWMIGAIGILAVLLAGVVALHCGSSGPECVRNTDCDTAHGQYCDLITHTCKGTNCSGKCGGPDGSGGTCPDTCLNGQICQAPGYTQCSACTPQCTGKCGGPDTCNGTCTNTCGVNQTCQAPDYTQCSSGCTNGAKQCNGTVIQTCTNGTWVNGTDCHNTNQTCTNGACVGPCTNGAVQCNGTKIQNCTNNVWVDGTDCANTSQTCSNGACVGGCTNGAHQCSGTKIQNCVNNAWVDSGTDCATTNQTCSNGACVGGCTNGTHQCSGTKIQNCVNNAWVDSGTDCATTNQTCSNGACTGCTPNCTGKCGGSDGCNNACPDTCVSPQGCNTATWTCENVTCPSPVPTVTISQIQNPNAAGHVPDGCEAKLVDVIATTDGKKTGTGGANGYVFVEDAGGGEWSGLYVYGKSMDFTPFVRGTKLAIDGKVGLYYGRVEFNAVSLPTTNGTATVPAPAIVTPAEVATGGTKAPNYLGVLAEVQDVKVTDVVFPGTDGGDHGDFEVAPSANLTQKLVVGWAFRYSYSCPPTVTDGGTVPCGTDQRTVGDHFTSITGVMDYTFGNNRIQPRDDNDLVKSP